MYILCLGLNHTTAEIALRERVGFTEEAARAALARLSCGSQCFEPVSELVILSTCNRVELYAASPAADFRPLEQFLAETRGVSPAELIPHLYRYTGEAAVEHLYEVAAGLDSLVLGEAQILGQVTRALEMARGADAARAVLGRLFQGAIHAGKRARAETTIACNPASVSTMAVRLAAAAVPNLANACVVVLGAGETAELTVEALRKRGVSRIRVVNRTLERAQALADRWQGEADTFEALPEALAWGDIVISSTSAPHTLIDRLIVEAGLIERRVDYPLVLVDIAVPRDIDPEVGKLPNVLLYDLDHLQHRLDDSLAERQSQVPHVREILNEEKNEFLKYLSSLELLPLIAEINKQAEDIRRGELEKTLRRLPELSDEERQRVDDLTAALVRKLLHAPLGRLREQASGPSAAGYASLARTIFTGRADVHTRQEGGKP